MRLLRVSLNAISIHAPRTGSDSKPARSGGIGSSFQSTLPARGATQSSEITSAMAKFQSTLPARGATPTFVGMFLATSISIHAPRTGSDAGKRKEGPGEKEFQSTLPARGATDSGTIYPHCRVPFQSTLPARGATLSCVMLTVLPTGFQSTLPARGATRPPYFDSS